MNHLFHIKDKTIYCRTEILCWQDGQLMDTASLKGDRILHLLITLLKLNPECEYLVIDCKRLTEVDINFLRQLKSETEQLQLRTDLIFIRNPAADLESRLQEAGFRTNHADDPEKMAIVAANFIEIRVPHGQLAPIQKKYVNWLKETVFDFIRQTFSFHKQDDTDHFELLASTPLYTNGEFDMSLILSDPRRFVWTIAYAADCLDNFLKEHCLENRKTTKLLAVSLRSAPFANALAYLLGYEFFSIDHIGPNHKLFNLDFHKRGFVDGNYVYIGDFLTGGTEIKIAQNYVQFLGGHLNHAFLLGSCVPGDEKRFKDKFDFSYVYDLNQTPGLVIKYSLKELQL